MKTLDKPITRRCAVAAWNRRRLVVTLMPGDVLGFRLERCRQRYYIPLASCFSLAVKSYVAATAKPRRKARR